MSMDTDGCVGFVRHVGLEGGVQLLGVERVGGGLVGG